MLNGRSSRGGEIGRHAWLRAMCPQGRASSSLAHGTRVPPRPLRGGQGTSREAGFGRLDRGPFLFSRRVWSGYSEQDSIHERQRYRQWNLRRFDYVFEQLRSPSGWQGREKLVRQESGWRKPRETLPMSHRESPARFMLSSLQQDPELTRPRSGGDEIARIASERSLEQDGPPSYM